MKDQDTLNEVWVQEMWEDFDGFIAQETWSECAAIIVAMGDAHCENDAVRMNHVLNASRKNAEIAAKNAEMIKDVKDDGKGIRWTEGTCFNCSAEIDPYLTKCPKCFFVFTD